VASGSDLCFTPATELVAMIRDRQVSPVEVVEALFSRMERINPLLNAYCTVTAEKARQEAKAAEQAVMRAARQPGHELGALHGVPCSIKDVTYTAGVRTTLGSKLYEQYIPTEDAPVVERLKAAGSIVVGKTCTPELGWKGVTDSPLFGITRNPWNRGVTPGGSSGGAAAAVAAGLGPLATGTDGAGSIRIPASFCGIVGHKPTFGLVPYYPPSAAELVAHVGPLTRTVRDAALMLDVMSGRDDRDRHSLPAEEGSYLAACTEDIKGLRLAWSATLGNAPLDAEVRRIVEQAVRRFTDLGCVVEAASPAIADPAETIGMLFYCGVAGRIAAQPDGWRAVVDPGLVRIVDEYRPRTAYDLTQALAQRNALWDTIRPFFERFDLLLTPTMPLPAFPVGRDFPDTVAGQRRTHLAWTPFTYPFNLTGQPAISLPCGWTSGGLPVGLQIIGRRLDDRTVLRAAAAFEAMAPWVGRRPPEM
jgi:aspartyl-tRNA(Asn)/glutamyl-tRNA(Gln) amidotransferase subunit A